MRWVENMEKSAVVMTAITENNTIKEIHMRTATSNVSHALQRRIIPHKTTLSALKSYAVVAVGVWGFIKGLKVADKDISLLGIGFHRNFLFHSAIGLAGLKYIHTRWSKGGNGSKPGKTIAFMGGCYAFGVSAHLIWDAFTPKAVIFPLFGSLVNGTMLDDTVWLLGNAGWAFKIGCDFMSHSA